MSRVPFQKPINGDGLFVVLHLAERVSEKYEATKRHPTANLTANCVDVGEQDGQKWSAKSSTDHFGYIGDKILRTIPEREHRAVAGLSMGGPNHAMSD